MANVSTADISLQATQGRLPKRCEVSSGRGAARAQEDSSRNLDKVAAVAFILEWVAPADDARLTPDSTHVGNDFLLRAHGAARSSRLWRDKLIVLAAA
eukprot:1168660-Rhodomonas_salina.2